MKTWPVQDAKARFSELLVACEREGPQVITKRGVEAAVLVPFAEWRRLVGDIRPDSKTSCSRTKRAPTTSSRLAAGPGIGRRANSDQTCSCSTPMSYQNSVASGRTAPWSPWLNSVSKTSLRVCAVQLCNFVILGSSVGVAHGQPRARVPNVVGSRFPAHTISGPGFNLFKSLRRHFRANPFCRQRRNASFQKIDDRFGDLRRANRKSALSRFCLLPAPRARRAPPNSSGSVKGHESKVAYLSVSRKRNPPQRFPGKMRPGRCSPFFRVDLQAGI